MRGLPVYIQLEQDKVCFKIDFSESEEGLDLSAIQDEWQHKVLMEKSVQYQMIEIQRPYPYVHRGTYRTVAVVTAPHWLCDENQRVTKNRVVEKLLLYRQFEKDVLSEVANNIQ